MFRSSGKKGFTLIELLVVISIISLLSSVVLSSLSSARAKARDARRKTDLVQIRTALEMYYSNCGTYVVAQNCTGATYGSGGWGWFNYAYTATGSVGKGLVDNNVIKAEIIDPSGQISSDGIRTGYMIGADSNHYTVWTNLERPSTADTNTLNNCYFDGYDSYHSSYQASARTNYCISN